MEVFKSEPFKKEFKELLEVILPSLNACGNCSIFCCKYPIKFSMECSFCRESRCKNCTSFERSKEVLLNTGDKISKKYVANFIVDYLNLNDTTAKLFNLNISDSAREKKNYFATSFKK